MKSFVKYLTESDYKRFLKKNKNLDKAQIEKINTYFSKTNTHAAADIKWQDRKLKDKTYDYFDDIMIKYESGRKVKKFKLSKISGLSHGIESDYFYIKTSSRQHECFMPLNFRASIEIASRKYGGVRGKWCVADESHGEHYWREYTDSGEVFVYVITNDDKWAVHIQGNRKIFHVWDKFDNHYSNSSTPFINKEVIPGFSIKNELMKSKLKKLYSAGSEQIQRSYEDDDDYEDEQQTVEDYFAEEVAQLATNHNTVEFGEINIDPNGNNNDQGVTVFIDFNNYNPTLKNCEILISNDGIDIRNGTVIDGTFDADELGEVNLYDCDVHGGTFNEVNEFDGGKIKGGTVNNCNVSSVDIYGGLFYSSSIEYSKIMGGSFLDTYISGTWVDGVKSTFKGCNCESTLGSMGRMAIEGGVWEECSFDNCDFKHGRFSNSCTVEDSNVNGGNHQETTFYSTDMESGNFYDSIFNKECHSLGGNYDGCTWEGGNWDDGTWKNGVWNRGDFDGGVWESGIWNEGNFREGDFRNGIMVAGTFIGDTFKGTLGKLAFMKSGRFISGNFHGTFYGDIFEDGNFHGIWKGTPKQWKAGDFSWDDGARDAFGQVNLYPPDDERHYNYKQEPGMG